MSRIRQVAWLFFLFVFLLGAAGGIYAHRFISSGLPAYPDLMTLQGQQEKIQIRHDHRGVPHVRSFRIQDLFFAQGFIHARDRLWQMELQRRVVQGRLSEIFGQKFLGTDEHLRRIGLSRIAQRILRITSSQNRQILESYAEGVNEFIRQHSLPVQFRLLGFHPALWTPQDSAGIVSLMAYNLGRNWRAEALRQGLSEQLSENRYKEIVPPYEDWHTPSVLPATQEKHGEWIARLLEDTDLSEWQLPSTGSNSWVIAPSRSSTDTAVLANDPHLSLELPCIWHEINLGSGDELTVHGWSIPGAPGVVIGQNDRIAWGMTNVGDSQDLFLEKRKQDAPLLFRCDGQWKRAGVRKEKIQVKDREHPEVIKVITTRHGPLISKNPPMSLSWTAYEIERSTIDAILGINRADNWKEFQLALKDFSIPIQGVVYADVEGNIGFRTAGRIPIRKQGKGLSPSPGWDTEYGWQGFVPIQEMPRAFNPEKGFLATANHRVTGRDSPYPVHLDAAPPYRMQRIVEYLSKRKEITPRECMRLQNDWYNRHAAEHISHWVELLKDRRKQLSEIGRKGLAVLREWKESPVNHPGSAGAAIFQVWYLRLIEEVFQERLGEVLWQQFVRNASVAYNALEYLLRQEETTWLPRGVKDPLLSSYKGAVKELKALQGKKPREWRWDKLQAIEFEHDLGKVPVMGDYLFNRGPYPYGGGPMTVGRAAYSLSEPFKVDLGAGLRFLSVLREDGIKAKAVLAGGQSGHPLSEHYDDQIETWLDGEYYTLGIPGQEE